MKAILFEDNYIAKMALELMVDQLGCEVIGSYDSADDLASLLERDEVNCLLMDIQLNGKKSGLEAVEQIRAHSQVPVIFLSGNSSVEILDRIRSIDHSTLLSKPYTEAALREKCVEMGLIK